MIASRFYTTNSKSYNGSSRVRFKGTDEIVRKVSVCWSVPATPVYNLIHEHISKPLILSNGIVTLDGADLVKFDFEGNFIWHCPDDLGGAFRFR